MKKNSSDDRQNGCKDTIVIDLLSSIRSDMFIEIEQNMLQKQRSCDTKIMGIQQLFVEFPHNILKAY